MANVQPLVPGQRVQVIDPDDGYYLMEGEIEEVHGSEVFVRFAADDSGQRFRPGQLRTAVPPPPETADEDS